MADGDAALYSVIAGLAVGILFIVLVSYIFQPSISAGSPRPLAPEPIRSQIIDATTRIALQNATLHEAVENRELVATYYRGEGVGHAIYNCLNKGCALIIFSDKSDPDRDALVSVFVNKESKEVVGIDAAPRLLISKLSDVREVEFFLSKHPDAAITVNPSPGYPDVLYEAGFQGSVLSLNVKTTPTGEVIEVSAQCSGRGPTFTVTDDVMEFLETTDCIG